MRHCSIRMASMIAC